MRDCPVREPHPPWDSVWARACEGRSQMAEGGSGWSGSGLLQQGSLEKDPSQGLAGRGGVLRAQPEFKLWLYPVPPQVLQTP